MSIGTGILSRTEPRHTGTDKDADTYFKKALECAAIGEFTEAIDALHQVTKTFPDNLQAWNAKAMLYRLMGNGKMAALCAETANHLTSTK